MDALPEKHALAQLLAYEKQKRGDTSVTIKGGVSIGGGGGGGIVVGGQRIKERWALSDFFVNVNDEVRVNVADLAAAGPEAAERLGKFFRGGDFKFKDSLFPYRMMLRLKYLRRYRFVFLSEDRERVSSYPLNVWASFVRVVEINDSDTFSTLLNQPNQSGFYEKLAFIHFGNKVVFDTSLESDVFPPGLQYVVLYTDDANAAHVKHTLEEAGMVNMQPQGVDARGGRIMLHYGSVEFSGRYKMKG